MHAALTNARTAIGDGEDLVELPKNPFREFPGNHPGAAIRLPQGNLPFWDIAENTGFPESVQLSGRTMPIPSMHDYTLTSDVLTSDQISCTILSGCAVDLGQFVHHAQFGSGMISAAE